MFSLYHEMPSDTFTIIQQHISSTTQCPNIEKKKFLEGKEIYGSGKRGVMWE